MKQQTNFESMENTRVWKIASRWSEDGNINSSVIGVFRKNNIVFLGKEKNRDRFAKEVHCGDYFAVTDGIRVVAIAKAVGEPKVITEFKIQEIDKSKFDYEDWVWGIKVRIIDLPNEKPNEKQFDYCRGTFHSAESYRDKIIDLYNEDDKKFTIKSYTYVFEKTSNNDAAICSILDSQIHYVIPIYQRIYSWTNNQIEKLIRDIFEAYWGVDGKGDKNPFFIGTMQLSEKKFIDKNKYEQNIIDGQQRLSTFLLILKVLQLKFPEQLIRHKFDWLETRVNNGEQQIYLNEFLACDSINLETKTNNPYLKNAIIVNEILQQYMDNDDIETKFEVREFVEFILNQVYFVVIETCAGLSKTLQIFNSINTTGLDLNGGDIFKIRMYEYLTDKKGRDESVFDEISKIYELLDEKNRSGFVVDINGILQTYQFVLISKYDLPNDLCNLGHDTFFERLFDTILNVYKWPGFSKVNDPNFELSLDEIIEIIKLRYEWHKRDFETKAEDICVLHLIGWSRYSKYWILLLVFLYKYKDDSDKYVKLQTFSIQLNKLYSIYSIRYWRRVNRLFNTFSPQLLKNISSQSFNELIEFINQQIKEENNEIEITNILKGEITGNNVVKNIICRTSAMLDEDYKTFDSNAIGELKEKLFGNRIDIEHISSYSNEDVLNREQIQKEWGHKLNTIGNLVVLEEKINRSIQNKSKKKPDAYKSSSYLTVRKLANYVDNWTLKNCEERMTSEIEKMIIYWFR